MAAMAALAPAIFGHFITISQGQNPQWKNSINTPRPQYWKPKYAPEIGAFLVRNIES